MCKRVKGLHLFPRNSGRPGGFYRDYACKKCHKQKATEWAADPKNKERVRSKANAYRRSAKGRAQSRRYRRLPKAKERANTRRIERKTEPAGQASEFASMLRRHYSMEVHDWAALYNNQNGKCAACAKPLGFDKQTHVDHDHATGRVRGLLCQGCNAALGQVGESAVALRGLLKYLEEACGK